MDQQQARDILSGRRRGPKASALRAGLCVAAAPYAAAMRLRRWAYRKALLSSRKASLPVICVGNLTTGGTGKTPMVAWVVARLKQADRNPAVLTRGYKPAHGMSDEAEMLRGLCDVPVIVNADRLAGAAAAAEAGADVCVMDDGFQHLRLRRDLDVVLIDATNPFGYGRCLPRGLLREPVSALREADAIVITRSDRVDRRALEKLRGELGRLAGGATLHAAVHRPVKVLDEKGGEMPPSALAGRKIGAFCGLGNPEDFFATLEALQVRLLVRRSLDDHVVYSPRLLEGILAEAVRCGCDVLVTTQKDHVKLPAGALSRPVWQLAVEMAIVGGERELTERIVGAACGS